MGKKSMLQTKTERALFWFSLIVSVGLLLFQFWTLLAWGEPWSGSD